MHRLATLKTAYFFLMYALVLIIVLTPFLIRGGVSIFSEEFVEGGLILCLLAVGVGINFFYERELDKQEQSLQDAWKHIGAVNLLVERFRLALTDDTEYPKNKKELQLFTAMMLGKIRGVVPCDALLLRVVETQTLKTMFEYSEGEEVAVPKIGNKELVKEINPLAEDIVSSQSDEVKIKTFVVFSSTDTTLTEDRRMLIQKIVNDFTTVYVISTYIL